MMINQLKMGKEKRGINTINFDCLTLMRILKCLEAIYLLTKMNACKLRVDL